MKKWILAGALGLLMPAVNAFGGVPCGVYEYQEMKDMYDDELQAAIAKADELEKYNRDYGVKAYNLGAESEGRRALGYAAQCHDQLERLSGVKEKRVGPKPRPSMKR